MSATTLPTPMRVNPAGVHARPGLGRLVTDRIVELPAWGGNASTARAMLRWFGHRVGSRRELWFRGRRGW
jgi:hypothetical protein